MPPVRGSLKFGSIRRADAEQLLAVAQVLRDAIHALAAPNLTQPLS
jgi:hypothetical protein